ncbi:hypothetical protein GF373_07275 [bacterium]|nr:hypothetical protein [bacterium]
MKKLTFMIASLLGVLFAFQPAQVTIGDEEEQIKFIGARRCKMCHNKSSSGKYYDDWEKKAHANAFLLLKGDERKNPKCLKCHTTGYGKEGGFEKPDEDLLKEKPELDDMIKAMAGVQCEECHGPGGKHMKSRKGNVIPNKGVPDKESCVTCHNDENPNWDPNRYTLPDGSKSGFYFKEAVKKVNHSGVKKDEEEK